jgi:pyridoxine kinase
MPLVLVIGSHVAGSRVGGTVVSLALALSPAEVDPMHVPTTLLGRHPGWGAPGGGAVAASIMEGMLEGIAANGLFGLLDGVITDYFAAPEQVAVAADAIRAIKAERPEALVLVDPVMGDEGRLYVSEAVAGTIADQLVPLAGLLTPNLTELARLTGQPLATTAQEAVAAARLLPCPALVTSVPVPGRADQTGTLWVEPAEPASPPQRPALLFAHERVEGAPRGTGDLLAAALMARLLEGLDGPLAAAHATATVAEVVRNAAAWRAPELPVVGAREAWQAAPLVGVEVLA